MPDLPRADEPMLQRHLREVRELLAKQALVEEVTR